MITARDLARERLSRRSSDPFPVPSPVGGLNTRDALASMEATDAIAFNNWFPALGFVRIRNGYEEFATGMGSGTVSTLAELRTGSAAKLVAGANANLYDITAGGTASSLGSGFTNNIWQSANFNANLVLVNGDDDPQQYDGSTLSSVSLSGSGLTPANLIGVTAHRSRLYWWEDNSQDFWYGNTNALGGALTKFPLSRLGSFGGKLVAIASWTHDGGDGKDDLAVFFMSTGETIVYQGSDPGSATDWALVGIYRIPEPVDRRAIQKVGGDLVVLTVADLLPLTRALPTTGLVLEPSKLSGAVLKEVLAHGAKTGWQFHVNPRTQHAILNVPISASEFRQYGYNTTTGAPFYYTGIPAACWGDFQRDLYFGGTDGRVFQFTGFADEGAQIIADAQTAWTSLGSRAVKKTTAIRPLLSGSGGVSYGIKLGADFRDPRLPLTIVNSATSGSAWDTSPWDTSPWSPEQELRRHWVASGLEGVWKSLRLRAISNGSEVRWYSTSFLMERGGGI